MSLDHVQEVFGRLLGGRYTKPNYGYVSGDLNALHNYAAIQGCNYPEMTLIFSTLDFLGFLMKPDQTLPTLSYQDLSRELPTYPEIKDDPVYIEVKNNFRSNYRSNNNLQFMLEKCLGDSSDTMNEYNEKEIRNLLIEVYRNGLTHQVAPKGMGTIRFDPRQPSAPPLRQDGHPMLMYVSSPTGQFVLNIGRFGDDVRELLVDIVDTFRRGNENKIVRNTGRTVQSMVDEMSRRLHMIRWANGPVRDKSDYDKIKSFLRSISLQTSM